MIIDSDTCLKYRNVLEYYLNEIESQEGLIIRTSPSGGDKELGCFADNLYSLYKEQCNPSKYYLTNTTSRLRVNYEFYHWDLQGLHLNKERMIPALQVAVNFTRKSCLIVPVPSNAKAIVSLVMHKDLNFREVNG